MKHTMLKRHEIILEVLEKYAPDCVSGSFLAQACEVSSKTIRSDIQLLNQTLHKDYAQIQALPSKGYTLQIYDNTAYQLIKMEYLENEADLPSGTISRSNFIIRTMLRRNGYLRIEDLSEQLFIDRTSISRDLKIVREFLNSYHLHLDTKSGYGLMIVGDEIHKRICMNEIFTYEMIDEIIPIQPSIVRKISQVLDTDGISMMDASFDSLCIYLHIMLDRIQQGYHMHFDQEIKTLLKQEYEYQVAKDIIAILQEIVSFDFEEEELCFLAVHLIGKRMNFISDVESCLVDILPEDVDAEVVQLFEHIKSRYGIDFINDYYLKKALGLHIIAMKNRVRFATYLKNPLLHQIRSMYLLAYEISVDIWMYLHPTFDFLFSEDEIAYFAIHIQYALERSGKAQKKKKVLLINNLNSSSTELLAYELISRFDSYMEIKDSIYPHRLEEYDIKNYDAILSTVDLPIRTELPVIKIDSILNEHSLANVTAYFLNQNMLSFGTYVKAEDIQHVHGLGNQNMVMQEIKDCFFSEQSDAWFQEFCNREKTGSSALTNLIALPHCFIEAIKSSCRILILDKPIAWNTLMVQVIIVCVIPLGHCDIFFYEVLHRLLQEHDLIEKLTSSSSSQIKSYLDQYD